MTFNAPKLFREVFFIPSLDTKPFRFCLVRIQITSRERDVNRREEFYFHLNVLYLLNP